MVVVYIFVGEEVFVVIVSGDEGMVMVFLLCCCLIFGDLIVGYIGKGEGLQIYVQECCVVKCLYGKDLEYWIDVMWVEYMMCVFDVLIKVLVCNMKGIFVCVVVDLILVDVNVVYVLMEQEGDQEVMYMMFLIQVYDCVYFVDVMCVLWCNLDVICIV